MASAAPLRHPPPTGLSPGPQRFQLGSSSLPGSSPTSLEPPPVGSRQPSLACSARADVRIFPGLAPFSLLYSDPSTNAFLSAGDRAEGGEEGLGWEAQTGPSSPSAPC